nr:MAG TPA: hypothetical protein [Caudoviricetes sp.]
MPTLKPKRAKNANLAYLFLLALIKRLGADNGS